MKKIISLLLAVILFSGAVFSAPTASSLTANDLPQSDGNWYKVSTAQQLEYALYNLSDKNILLTEDIIFESSDFSEGANYPEGFLSQIDNHSFGGTFNGGGHSIKNAKMHEFCTANYGTVKNLIINNCEFIANRSFCVDNFGTIENCRLLLSTAQAFVNCNNEGALIKNCVIDDGVLSSGEIQGKYAYTVQTNSGVIDRLVNFTSACTVQTNSPEGIIKNCIDLENSELNVEDFSDIQKCFIKLSQTSYVYDGESKEPEITVEDEKANIISPETDYTLTYENNKNAGTACVKIEGKGLFYGSMEAEFTIKPSPLKTSDVRLNTVSYWYDGKAKTPAASVKGVGGKLKLNKDYTLTYSNNKNPGTATATVTGTGNYSGSFKRNFKITIPKVTSLTSYNNKPKCIPLKWKALSGINSYEVQIYNSKSKKWVTKLKTSKNYANISKLTKAGKYSFRVRAYKSVASKKYCGAFSAVLTDRADYKPLLIKKPVSGRLLCYTSSYYSKTKDLSVERTKKTGKSLVFYGGKKFKVLGKNKRGGTHYYISLKYKNTNYYGYVPRHNVCVENAKTYNKKTKKAYNPYYKKSSNYDYCTFNNMPFYQFNQTNKAGRIHGLYISHSCGPHSLAAALSALKGDIIFPEQIMGAMSPSVTNSGGKGSNISDLAKNVAPYIKKTHKLNFEYKKILPHRSFDYLKKGYMVILGLENRDGLRLFTSGSHYILLVGYDSMGNVVTLNSNLKTHIMDSFSISRIKRNIKNSWFYRENTIAIKCQYNDTYSAYSAEKKASVIKNCDISEHALSMGNLTPVKIGKKLSVLGTNGAYYYVSYMKDSKKYFGYIGKKYVKI